MDSSRTMSTIILSQTFQFVSLANLVISKSTGESPGDGYLKLGDVFFKNTNYITSTGFISKPMYQGNR